MSAALNNQKEPASLLGPKEPTLYSVFSFEKLYDVISPLLSSDVQRRSSKLIFDIRECAMFQEKVDYLDMALFNGFV